MIMTLRCCAALICLLLLLLPVDSKARIYKYRDADGRLTFVDDESKIPGRYQEHAVSVDEADDALVVYDTPGDTVPPSAGESDEVVPPAKIDDELRRLYQTPVTIEHNRILVPVEVSMGNRTSKLTLLLDTGASRTVFHREAITDLDLPSGRAYKARIAGGGLVTSNKIRFRQIRVGPFEMRKAYAMVISLNGRKLPFDGMLGMDFLKAHPYTIDYDKQLIQWQPPVD
jgi:hypothetical protein